LTPLGKDAIKNDSITLMENCSREIFFVCTREMTAPLYGSNGTENSRTAKARIYRYRNVCVYE
jgi:hypothetical protein